MYKPITATEILVQCQEGISRHEAACQQAMNKLAADLAAQLDLKMADLFKQEYQWHIPQSEKEVNSMLGASTTLMRMGRVTTATEQQGDKTVLTVTQHFDNMYR